MAPWRQLRRGLRALLRRSTTDREIADEVQHYLDEAAAAHRARGLPPEAALRAARLELGGTTAAREEIRGYGWENAVESVLADLRFAARRLRAEPVFTTVALVTLALGIGGTTAIFTVIRPILLEPLPYPDSGRLAAIWEVRDDGARNEGSFGMFRGLADRTRSFSSLAVLRPWQPTLTGAGNPSRLEGQQVSAGYFGTLGVVPASGRDFQPADDRDGGPPVIIIADALRRRLGDRRLLGERLLLNGIAHEIIGVMPADFEDVLGPSTEVWTPLRYDLGQGRAWGHHLRTIGRLAPGVDADRAAVELTARGAEVIATHRPGTYGPAVRFAVTPLRDEIVRAVRPTLVAVFVAMTLVLVIACANVADLIIARAIRRRGEFALRAALGAGRTRLGGQLLAESLLLAIAGGLVSMIVAHLGVRALVAASPASLPRVAAIGVDATALGFAMAVAALAGLGLGLVPLSIATGRAPGDDLRRTTPRAAGSGTRGGFVVAQVAIAMVLLVSSGLLVRSLQRLFAVDPGFDPVELLTLQVQTAGPRFDDDGAARRFFAEALAAVRAVPGVAAAAFTSQLPLSGDVEQYGVRFESGTVPSSAEDQGAFRYAVSAGYFEAMGMSSTRGRLLASPDRAGAPPVALINESYARRRLPGRDPLGERIWIGGVETPYTIVGIVPDVKQLSLAVGPADAVYVAADQWPAPDRTRSLVVRSTGNPTALVAAVRGAIWSVDPDQAVTRVATMADLLADRAAERRFALLLFQVFALTGLLLAAAGVYGVVTSRVTERTREIGVRAAMGATSGGILFLVLRNGLILSSVGIAIGLVGAVGAGRAISAMLFGISPLDPLTYLAVSALLIGVTVAASALPAWRAARLDPIDVLRAE